MLFARARLSRRMRRANLPPPPAPYTVDAWCAAIGEARGSSLLIRELPLGAGMPPAVVLRKDNEDTIFVDPALSSLARTQVVLHEVAHVVLEHPGDALRGPVDPAIEVEAELAADLLSQCLTQAATTHAAHRAAAAGVPSRRGAPSAWWADRRTDWHLLQLWMTLRDGMPDAAIVGTSTAAPAPVEIRGRRQRYRTVVEIHDALRILRPWCSSQVRDSATRRARRHRLEPDAVVAVAEAATVAVALRHRGAARHRGGGVALRPGFGDVEVLGTPHDVHDVLSEARRLADIARALHGCALVAAETARWAPVVTTTIPAAPPRRREAAARR
ncbi:DUF6545 domain-containing protein [Micromonospora sp. WMMD1082]|uniref:DUF6545 domain-containing protein n=1 Tax=Micromonospora sp. WMMD1082 TaxID=3016104 RepID=UPI00241665CA|nr:DUF6545 domain-containing protein [Micromonospora sp. WMMD1082]MDG4794995.1 hypothetical protein [Micromonospora sp. WMMD1082]